MFQKRTSPNLISDLPAGELGFGDTIPFHGKIVPIKRYPTQAKPCGTCDHKRKHPRFYEPASHHKKRPKVLHEAIHALQQTYRHAKLLAKLFYRKQKVHSQRREAIIRVLQVMLQYMDLETCEIGFFNTGGDFIRLDTAKIAEYTNLSLVRTNRAICDITKAGYLTTIRQYKKTTDGRKIGMTAIRTLSRNLFRDLKIDHFSLFSAMDRKKKQNEKLLAKKNKARLRNLMQSIAHVADKTGMTAVSAIRKATMLLDHVAQEIIPIINQIERKNE